MKEAGMNIIRQETDYALRLMARLGTDGKSKSTKLLSQESDVPYEFACKILQKLQSAGLIESTMGPRGGFKLSLSASSSSLWDVISAVQGSLTVNNCYGEDVCCRKDRCPVSGKMGQLQDYIEKFFSNILLAEVLQQKRQLENAHVLEEQK
jgi:Rrf2 family protein